MSNFIPVILAYLVYLFAITIANNINRKNILKLLISNNLINNSEGSIKFDFSSIDDKKRSSSKLLPVALGLAGFAIGLLCGAYMINNLAPNQDSINARTWYDITDAIQLGTPLFFAAVGVIVAYFIEKREQKKE